MLVLLHKYLVPGLGLPDVNCLKAFLLAWPDPCKGLYSYFEEGGMCLDEGIIFFGKGVERCDGFG